MSRSSPLWKRPPERSAEAVWAVAHDVIGRGGQVRLEDVAEATGIPRATVYYYFPGRDPFVEWVVTEELRRAERELGDDPLAELFERWRSRPTVAARLTDAATEPTDEWRALVVAVARRLGTPRVTTADEARANALLGAVLTSAVQATTPAAARRGLAAVRTLARAAGAGAG